MGQEAELIICCSNYVRGEMVDGYQVPADKIAVIPCGVDERRWRVEGDLATYRTLFARPEERIVGYVGRLDQEKGIPTLVEAFAAVLAAHPEARLVLAGKGVLQQQPARAGAAGRHRGPGALRRLPDRPGAGGLLPLLRCAGGAQPVRAVRDRGSGGDDQPHPGDRLERGRAGRDHSARAHRPELPGGRCPGAGPGAGAAAGGARAGAGAGRARLPGRSGALRLGRHRAADRAGLRGQAAGRRGGGWRGRR